MILSFNCLGGLRAGSGIRVHPMELRRCSVVIHSASLGQLAHSNQTHPEIVVLPGLLPGQLLVLVSSRLFQETPSWPKPSFASFPFRQSGWIVRSPKVRGGSTLVKHTLSRVVNYPGLGLLRRISGIPPRVYGRRLITSHPGWRKRVEVPNKRLVLIPQNLRRG